MFKVSLLLGRHAVSAQGVYGLTYGESRSLGLRGGAPYASYQSTQLHLRGHRDGLGCTWQPAHVGKASVNGVHD